MEKNRFIEYQDRFFELRRTNHLIEDYQIKTENSNVLGCLEKIMYYFAFACSCCNKVLLSMFAKYCHKVQERPEIKGLGLLYDESMWYFKENINDITELIEEMSHEDKIDIDLENLKAKIYELQYFLDYVVKSENTFRNIPTSQIRVDRWGKVDPAILRGEYLPDDLTSGKFLVMSDTDIHTLSISRDILNDLEQQGRFEWNECYYADFFIKNFEKVDSLMWLDYIIYYIFSKITFFSGIASGIKDCLNMDSVIISSYLCYCTDVEKSHYSKWNNDSHELFTCQEKDLRLWIKILDSTEELFRDD